MPSREQMLAVVTKLIENSLAQHGRSLDRAWLAIYETLLWYEQNAVLPHIIDADKLKKSSQSIWPQRAKCFEEYLANAMRCEPDNVHQHVDKLFQEPGYVGLQRQNPLGIAFAAIIKYLLEQFGNQSLEYRNELLATDVFPGIQLPGRSEAPRIDIAAFKKGILVCMISAKWSIRHDRMGDFISECRAYKSAAMWTNSLKYYVVTNEFDPGRLSKVLGDSCLDGVAHVHKRAVTEVCQMNGRLTQLKDLADLIIESHKW